MLKQYSFYFFISLFFLSCESQVKKPNILFIFVDDLGYADLSCYGSDDVLSPNIDLLATNGIKCTSAYVTAPQCGPSRAGVLSGQYQQRYGFEMNPYRPFLNSFGLDKRAKTMASYLKSEGYNTYGVGKWDVGQIPSAQPWSRGFDEFFGFYTGSRHYFTRKNEGNYQSFRDSPTNKFQAKGYVTDILTDESIA